MLPSHEQDRADFQRELDRLANNATLPLMPREYPGPVAIRRALVLDGQGSTIWALSGPVISCQAAGVTLRNLRLEVTGASDTNQIEHGCALKVEHGYTPRLENVEVRGTVIGIPEEEGAWLYPHAVQIGSVPFGSEHDLIMRIWVPVPCEISSKISGIEVQPHRLEPGTNEITLHIERIAKDTLLSGKLYLSTPRLKRCIALNGYVSSVKAKKSRSKKPIAPRIIYEPPDWETLLSQPRPPYPSPLPPVTHPDSPDPVVTMPVPPVLDPEITVVTPPSPPPVTEVPAEETRPSGPSIRWPPAPPPVVEPPPAEETRPSGPSIRWPPAPPPVVTRVVPPPPPVVEPPPTVVEPPPIIQPPGPGPVPPPRRSLMELLKSYRKVAITALAAIAVIAIAATAYWYFFSGFDPNKIKQLQKQPQEGGARTVAFSSDGKTLASGNNRENGIVTLWDVGTMESQALSPKRSEITSLMFSPDGTRLVAGTTSGGVIVWDVQTREELLKNFRHNSAVNSVAFSPDSKLVVSGGDDQISVWNVQSNQQTPLISVGVKNTKAVAFSPDGETIAGGNDVGDVKLWNAKTGSEKQPLPREHSGPITSLDFSPDGTKLVSASKDKKVMLWDVQNGKKILPFRHNAEVSAVAFCNDVRYFVTRSGSEVLVWDIDSIQPKKTLAAGDPTKDSPNGVAVSSGGKIASGRADGYLVLWGQ